MTKQNYNRDARHAALRSDHRVVLGTVIAKAQELAHAAGHRVRTVTLLITDGGDYGSTRCKPPTSRESVKDMLAQENHIVAAMGISDGHHRASARSSSRWASRPLDPHAG